MYMFIHTVTCIYTKYMYMYIIHVYVNVSTCTSTGYGELTEVRGFESHLGAAHFFFQSEPSQVVLCCLALYGIDLIDLIMYIMYVYICT